jgi:hypothetical protein
MDIYPVPARRPVLKSISKFLRTEFGRSEGIKTSSIKDGPGK